MGSNQPFCCFSVKMTPNVNQLHEFIAGHLLLTSALTYEVSGHLLILLHPAHVAELQEGVHMVWVHLEQQLQESSSLVT